MTRTVRVHLKAWTLDDGAVEPFGVGDRVELGLGIDVEQLPVVADQEDVDGVTPLPTPSTWACVRARADIVGPAQLVLDADGNPFSTFVTPLPGVPLVLIRRGMVDPEWNGRRVVVRGDVVVEPYLWSEGGLFRTSIDHRLRAAVVDRIQTLTGVGETDTRAQLIDVPRAVPHRIDGADYVAHLRFEKQ